MPYVRFGDGETAVVAISGGDAFVRRFEPASAVRHARRIATLFPATCRVYVLGYAAEGDVVELVADFIRTHAAQAIVAGVSFGGLIALRVAASVPHAVRGLVLLSGGPRFSDEGRARIAEQIATLERGDLPAMAAPFATLFRRPWLNAIARCSLWLRRRSLASRMNDPEFIIRMLQMALTIEITTLPRCPTSILIGERDQFFDVGAARAFGDVVCLPRETHMVAIENAEAVREAIQSIAPQT